MLRFRGKGATPAEDLRRVRDAEGVKVVEEPTTRLMLVDAPEDAMATLGNALPDWLVSPQGPAAKIPDRRERVRGPAF